MNDIQDDESESNYDKYNDDYDYSNTCHVKVILQNNRKVENRNITNRKKNKCCAKQHSQT